MGLMDKLRTKAAEMAMKQIEYRNEATSKGVVHTCQSCGAKNRVPYDRVNETATCGKCKESFVASHYPIDARTQTSFDTLVSSVQTPIVVDFWAAWCGPCIAGMPQLIDAAGKSDGRFVTVRANVDEVRTVAERHNLAGVPSMLRFVGGSAQKDRMVGMHQSAEIVKFGVGS